jgi:hypothetical protein
MILLLRRVIRAPSAATSSSDERLVTGASRCPSETQPMRRRPPSHGEPCSATVNRFEHVFPRDRVAAVAIGYGQHQIARPIDRGNDERVGRTGYRRHDVPRDHRLALRQHTRRTGRAPVINGVPAVPARSTSPTCAIQGKTSSGSCQS